MSEEQENSNYSLDDFKRFLSGMQEVIGQAEREHKDLADALQENARLRAELAESKNELSKVWDNYESAQRELKVSERRIAMRDRRIAELRRSNAENKTLSKMEKDSETVLDVLLQAYKELDIEAMTKFEVAFSQLNDDADHRFQKQLDCFRQVRREKSKEKKQAAVMNIDNRGGNAFLYSHLDDTKFSQIR